jgi:GNAT superfamily N-acetyltransferase
MTMNEGRSEILIRDAEPGDVAEILTMIRELAVFEKLEHQVVATEERMQEALFGEQPSAEAMIARVGKEAVGYAVFFSTYSTFIGKAGLWLEDLYVREEHRGSGIGKAMLIAGARKARDRGCDRYEWCVLDWNQGAIDVYEAMGSDVMPDWRICRMGAEEIEELAAG